MAKVYPARLLGSMLVLTKCSCIMFRMNIKSRTSNDSSVDCPVTIQEIRSRFPALGTPTVFLDNAGGSQLPSNVIERMRDYMTTNYVQLGADYGAARHADEIILGARNFISTFANGDQVGKIVLGSSTSQLCAMLADCFGRARDSKRNEIIIAIAGHEANVGPWARLENSGYNIKWWEIDRQTTESPLSGLTDLLSSRTRVVALPHVSNLLGHINDISSITEASHRVGARVVVDGVAYAPHRAIDVAAWDVDFYVFSIYKVLGPHMAALFGRHDALLELEGPNHFFIDKKDVPYKFELGGVLHEGCAGVLGVQDYFEWFAGPGRVGIERTYSIMEQLEQPLIERLISFLKSKTRVRIIGPGHVGPGRVGTISFVHKTKSSKEIVLAINKEDVGIRYGHFYAYRLAQALGLDPDDGVVRTSLLHYNTLDEIDRLIDIFETIL
jgi:cysteine desulfurase family protein (TIGR01976 family)